MKGYKKFSSPYTTIHKGTTSFSYKTWKLWVKWKRLKNFVCQLSQVFSTCCLHVLTIFYSYLGIIIICKTRFCRNSIWWFLFFCFPVLVRNQTTIKKGTYAGSLRRRVKLKLFYPNRELKFWSKVNLKYYSSV